MYKTETHLTLLGLLFTFGNISKLRNLHAHLHTICNHSIIKLKACLQKCRSSSSHKNFTLLGLLFAFGTISKFRNFNAHLHAVCNHSIIKLQACLQKCRRSSSHKNVWRTDRRTDGGNDNIPELSFESAGINRP